MREAIEQLIADLRERAKWVSGDDSADCARSSALEFAADELQIILDNH